MEDLNSHLCEEGKQTDSEHWTRCPRASQWGRWNWRETSGGSTSPSLGWLFEKKSEQSKSWEQQQWSQELKASLSPSANAEDTAESEFSVFLLARNAKWYCCCRKQYEGSSQSYPEVLCGPAVTLAGMYLKELKAEACEYLYSHIHGDFRRTQQAEHVKYPKWVGEEISLKCIRQSAIQLLKDRHSDIPNNMNELVKHAARDVRHSWKGIRVILFIQGAEAVRGIETKWQGSAGPGRGRGNKKLVF